MERALRLGALLGSIAIAGCSWSTPGEDRHGRWLSAKGDEMVAALHEFERAHGKYPKSLDEVARVPDGLPATDSITYQRDGADYVLELEFAPSWPQSGRVGCRRSADSTAWACSVLPTEEQVCEIIERAAVEYRLSRGNLTGRYYCDPTGEDLDYYYLGLRYYPTPDELVGSNLLGWYAIDKSDGTVFEEDISDFTLIPLTPRPPFESE